MGAQEQLLAISPVDGRYAGRVEELSPITSEYGLIKYRVAVEAGWVSMLGSGILPDREPLTEFAQHKLSEFADTFTVDDALRVKEI